MKIVACSIRRSIRPYTDEAKGNSVSENHIVQLEVNRLHGSIDFKLVFFPGVNILFGANGSGKTTIIHILSNIVAGSFDRFAYLQFESIFEKFSDGQVITILSDTQQSHLDEVENRRTIRVFSTDDNTKLLEFTTSTVIKSDRRRDHTDPEDPEVVRIRNTGESLVGMSATYFPAFRATLEAFPSRYDPRESQFSSLDDFYAERLRSPRFRGDRSGLVTRHARRLFGDFVPAINYPSTEQITYELTDRIRESSLQFAKRSQELLNEAFLGAFKAAIGPSSADKSEDPADIREHGPEQDSE